MYRVQTILTGVGGGLAYNTLYFEAGAAFPDPNDAQDAAASFWNQIGSYIRTGSSSVVQGEVDTVDTVTGQVTATASLAPHTTANTGTGDPLPPANQFRLRLNTDTFLSGRRLRGAIFVPGLTESVSTGGAPTSSLTTDVVNAAVSTLLTGLPGLCVWQRPRKATETKPARLGTNGSVTGIQGLTYFSVLRSRRD